jgi:trigger factor
MVSEKNQKIHIAIPTGAGKAISCDLETKQIANEELMKSFHVTVPLHAIIQVKDDKVANIAKNVNINGFRPGKAPAAVVWKQYQEKISAELVNAFINEAVVALKNKLDSELALSPQVDIKKFSVEEGLEFEIHMEILPKIDLPDLSKVKLEKPVFEIKEEDITHRINQLADLRKNYVSANDGHEAQEGDQVVIDFEGKMNGEPFEGGKAENHHLELGSKSFIDGFEAQLVGQKKGNEVTVKVTFPDNYHKKEFAGKPAEFDVKIHDIKQARAFENHEELAKNMMFESLDQLKEKVKESLTKECENKAKIQVKTALFDHLDKEVNFNIPQKLHEEELKGMMAQLENLKKSGQPLDKSEEELKKEYEKLAVRRVKLGLLLTKMAEALKIKIENDDFINAVKAQVDSQHPMLAKQIIDYYTKNPKAVDSLRGPILEEKTVDAMLKEVSFKEKNVSVKDLLSV